MRVLEVRFRPQVDEALLIVGHLVWISTRDRQPALLRRSASLECSGESEAFVAKLEYLVSSTAPDCFERLQRLKSRFWSFVEVAPAALRAATSGAPSAMVKSWLRAQ